MEGCWRLARAACVCGDRRGEGPQSAKKGNMVTKKPTPHRPLPAQGMYVCGYGTGSVGSLLPFDLGDV